VLYSAQWNNDPLQVYSVRTEFPQSTKVDLPSAALLALSPAATWNLQWIPCTSRYGSCMEHGAAQMLGARLAHRRRK